MLIMSNSPPTPLGTISTTGAHTHSFSGNTNTRVAHTHNISGNTSNTSSGADYLPPYITVYVWYRKA